MNLTDVMKRESDNVAGYVLDQYFLKSLFQLQKHRVKAQKHPYFLTSPLTSVHLARSDLDLHGGGQTIKI